MVTISPLFWREVGGEAFYYFCKQIKKWNTTKQAMEGAWCCAPTTS